MKKPFILGAAGAAMLASCSSDEVISLNKQDMIRFNVQTELNTRAADVFCNNNMPGSFKLYAETNGNKYIDGAAYTVTNGIAESSADYYWPEGSVDFYAQVNGDDEFSWTAGDTPTFTDFSVASNPTAQKDLLYAVVKGASRPKDGGATSINFRHALSQIVFCAKNTNENLKVEIYGVAVCGVNGKGTYTFASETTTDNIVDHENTSATDQTTRGRWTSSLNPTSYTASLSEAVTLNTVNVTYPLTLEIATDEDGNETINTGDQSKYPDLAMLLIPQTTDAVSITKGMQLTEANGTYFLVKCNIYNVVKEDEKTSTTLLWGSENEGRDVLVPAGFSWEEGKKYIYTFIFGNGNGGYDPENPDPNNPVLLPIKFSCTVDDFIKGEDKDIEMKTTSDKSGSTEGNNE